MRVVAVDGGLATYGWCSFDDGVPLRVGYIETKKRKGRPPAEDLKARIEELTDKVWELLSELEPDWVVLEQFSYPRHASSAVKLSAGYVATLTACKMLQIPAIQIPRKAVLEWNEIEISSRGSRKRREEIKRKVLELADTSYQQVSGWPVAKAKRIHPADALVTGLCAVGDPKYVAKVNAQEQDGVTFTD